MRIAVKILFAVAGLALCAWLIAASGPKAVALQLAKLGGLAPLVFVPYLGVYMLDSLAWIQAFIHPKLVRLGFWRMFRIRWAGESVNTFVPTAYIGGEAVKMVLLERHGIQKRDSGSAAVTSKTCQVLAQVLFTGLGSLAALAHLPAQSPARGALFAVTAGAFGFFGVLFWVQRRGMFGSLRSLLGLLHIRAGWFERRSARFAEMDHQVGRFYSDHPKQFVRCTLIYLGGWLADASEVYVACYCLGAPIDWTQAIAIEAFVQVAKGVGLLIPGALGVQESGVVAMFTLFGLPAPVGAAYAVLRRARDVIYAIAGLALLAAERVPGDRARPREA